MSKSIHPIEYANHKEVLSVCRNGIILRIAFAGADERDRVVINANEEGERRRITPETRQQWNHKIRNTGYVDVIFKSRSGRKPSQLRTAIKNMETGDKYTIDEAITQTVRSTITNVANSYLPKRTFTLKGKLLTRIQ